jgi:hypothetical protein
VKDFYETENKKLRNDMKDSQASIIKLERNLKEKDYDFQKLNLHLKAQEDDLKQLQRKYEDEQERYRVSTEKTYQDLKKMYTEQIEKQKKIHANSIGDQDVLEQLREEMRKLAHDKIQMEELIQRLEG